MSEVVKIIDNSKMALEKMVNLTDKHIVQAFVERMTSLSKSAPEFGAPRLTGNLSDSITMEKLPMGVWRVYTQSAKGGKAAYAIWVILGTARMPGNDFFRRAFMKAKKEYENGAFDL